MRRDRVAPTWPLQASASQNTDNIRKFEEVGTAPAALKAAIPEALAFHQAIGAERKAARLRYLTLRWANRLKDVPRIRILSSLEPGQTWGLAMVTIDGLAAPKIASSLWEQYRIIVPGIVSGQPPAQRFDFEGVRVTPDIYTTIEEVDTFARGMEELARS